VFFATLLHPAIQIINKLTFKYKILAVLSILLTLLILPVLSYIHTIGGKSHIYQNQERSLSHIKQIHDLITEIQLHRGLTNSYIHGNLSLEKHIRESEKQLSQQFHRFIIQNREAITSLHALPKIVALEKNLQTLYLKNIGNKRYPAEIFRQHTKIISGLITLLQQLSDKNTLGVSDNLPIKNLAKILTDKLLLLQETTGKLRGLTTGILTQHHMTDSDKSELFALYSNILAMINNPMNKEIRTYLHHYPDIVDATQMMHYRLTNLLYIVHHLLLSEEAPQFDSQHFFKLASETIETQDHLYNMIITKYDEILQTLEERLRLESIAAGFGFLILLAVVLYLSTAFYYSVTRSIRKLHDASAAAANGNRKIAIQSDTDDEVSEALDAFNKMSHTLDEQISFLNSYKAAIDEASIVSKTDRKGIITYVNQKFCETSGYTKEELLGKSHNIVRHPHVPKTTFKEMWQTIKAGKVWHGIVKNKTKSGDYYIVDATIMPIFDANGAIVEYIGIRHDITELQKSKKKIQTEMKKQRIDRLTGLPNKIRLMQDLPKIHRPVLLYLNIDDFASLNDFYGTNIGDKVLRYTSRLLREKTRSRKSKLYKLSSDAFLVLLWEEKHSRNPESLLYELITYVEKETAECPDDKCVTISLSGGIATYQESDNAETLLSYAQLARKVARKENKKLLRYHTNLNKSIDYEKNIAWINKIKQAIQQQRIKAFFQPIVETQTGTVTKYETLVRLIEEDGKVVSPFFFLDIAKKARLYTQITKIVFDQAFAASAKYPHLEFSINISVEDIEDTETTAYIFDKLRTSPQPEKIILEITEDQEISDYGKINAFIKEAKNLGAKIAIDDFGSGYANFDHIIKLNADFIKIDGSLIKNIATDREALIITEAIIAFSKKLGSKTVAEFVHNEEVSQIVQSLGADYSQGYFLGEPLPEVLEEASAAV